jgi:phosphomannomutase
LSLNKVTYCNFEDLYFEYINQQFDPEKLQVSKLKLSFDAMYGSGQFIAKRIFKNAHFLHSDYNPGFNNQAPEPLQRNLQDLEKHLLNNPCQLSIVTDGDADRIAFYDDKSRFIDAHHIILLCIYYLHNYKKLTGKVVIAFSVSERIKALCEHYQIACQVTPIGFKYIAEIML